MSMRELRQKEEVELRQREKELVEQLFKLRFQRATGALENSSKVRDVKREIAQVKTLLSERAAAK